MRIISRSEWGFTGWTSQPSSVPLGERTEFYVHYDGAAHINITGNQVPQRIDAEHKANNWSGIGYHFVVDQAGNSFEGRGWDLQGAHCPDHNRSAFGVQIAIGGDQHPTDAALNACVDLYEEACRRTGRTLAKRGHKDGFATDCPGTVLYPWVQAGMPRPTSEDVMTPEDIAAVVNGVAALKSDFTHDALYWLDQAMSDNPDMSMGDHPLKWVVPSLHGKFAALKAEIAEISARVDALAGAGGVTQAQLDAAAEAGARAALAALGHKLID